MNQHTWVDILSQRGLLVYGLLVILSCGRFVSWAKAGCDVLCGSAGVMSPIPLVEKRYQPLRWDATVPSYVCLHRYPPCRPTRLHLLYLTTPGTTDRWVAFVCRFDILDGASSLAVGDSLRLCGALPYPTLPYPTLPCRAVPCHAAL